MFRYPLSQGAGSGTVRDARMELVLMVPASLPDADKRAAFIVESLNNPLHAAMIECEKQQAIAGARKDAHSAEFWRRLAGSCRKAASMI